MAYNTLHQPLRVDLAERNLAPLVLTIEEKSYMAKRLEDVKGNTYPLPENAGAVHHPDKGVAVTSELGRLICWFHIGDNVMAIKVRDAIKLFIATPKGKHPDWVELGLAE